MVKLGLITLTEKTAYYRTINTDKNSVIFLYVPGGKVFTLLATCPTGLTVRY